MGCACISDESGASTELERAGGTVCSLDDAGSTLAVFNAAAELSSEQAPKRAADSIAPAKVKEMPEILCIA